MTTCKNCGHYVFFRDDEWEHGKERSNLIESSYTSLEWRKTCHHGFDKICGCTSPEPKNQGCGKPVEWMTDSDTGAVSAHCGVNGFFCREHEPKVSA